MQRTRRAVNASALAAALLAAAAPALAATYLFRHAMPAGPVPSDSPSPVTPPGSGGQPPPPAPAACDLPWGGTIGDGRSATAYRTAGVPYGGTCEFETRTCADGVLNGSFASESCAVAQPASCDLPWGGELQHGGSATAFKAANLPYGGICEQETRTCADGALSGSFAAQSCTVAQPRSCSKATVRWGTYCSASVSAGAHDVTRNVSYGQWDPEMGGYSGSASFSCQDGSWVGGGSCQYSYKPPPCSGGGCGGGE